MYGGHCGQKKLYAKIRERFYWHYLTRDVAEFVRNCERCKRTKVVKYTKEPMVLTPTPQRPFDCIIIDTIGKLKKTPNDFEYAVTIVCDMSKYLVASPVKNKSANEVAKAIFEKFILVYGPIKQIRTDMGTEYCNEIIRELCKLMKIEFSNSTAYHHETLGTVERSHRTFNEYLRSYIEKGCRMGKMPSMLVYRYIRRQLGNSFCSLLYTRQIHKPSAPHSLSNAQTKTQSSVYCALFCK